MRRIRGVSERPRGVRGWLAVVLATGLVVASSALALAPAAPASALSGGDFMPGLIISDTLFYDSGAMTESQIQQFLAAKGSGLAGYSFNVGTRAALYAPSGTLRCAEFDGGTLAASTIIYRAQVACGISAKVLLVTLQKEQGLITKGAPSQGALDRAMGYACPDTAPCAPTTLGFGNQVYSGALQFITYKVNGFARQPGWNSIGYSPNAACGATTLYLQNYATAALYNYTPYQPDAAALANLSGTGDGCSSYGNRNFWVYYNTWFGSTLGLTPYPVVGPTMSGNSTLGTALTAVPGPWGGSPTFSYQWLRCTANPGVVVDVVPSGCAVIAGASGASYVSAAPDLGRYIAVLVTGTNSHGSMTSGTVLPAAIGTPANITTPSVSGSSTLGTPWTLDVGTWTGSPSLGIFWLRCTSPRTTPFTAVPTGCAAIPGANGSTYVSTSADLGQYLTAQVAGSNPIGFSLAGAISTVPLGLPSNTALPTVSGTMLLGSSLNLNTGVWGGTPTPTLGIFWLRCNDPVGTGFTAVPAGCTPIAGANSAHYVVTVADLGKYLTAQVAGSNSRGFSLAGAISTTKATGSAPVNTALPSVSGAVAVGSTWTVSTGTWSGSPTFGIFWLRCNNPIGSGFTQVPAGCTAIGGANSASYVVTSADAGKYVTVQVAGSNALGFSLAGAVSTTAITGGTSAAPTVTTLPIVSGATAMGSTWTVTMGSWTGGPTFGIFWLRCNNPIGSGFAQVPAECSAISGANSSSYTSTAADVGKYLTAQIAGSNASGFGLAGATNGYPVQTLASSPLVPVNVVAPSVTGSSGQGSAWSVTTGIWRGAATLGIFWLRCDDAISSAFTAVPSGCAAISGANGPTYTSGPADAGKYLTAQVAATGTAGFSLAGARNASAVS